LIFDGYWMGIIRETFLKKSEMPTRTSGKLFSKCPSLVEEIFHCITSSPNTLEIFNNVNKHMS
jgi:hypothetical protein